ncbi:MAG: methyltransferase domain-containing protein [Pyrobaculum sp.]
MLEAVAKYYDSIAEQYADKYLKSEYYRVLYQKIGEVLDRYIRPGARVLDIGAGTGFWSVYMQSRGASVLALDLSSQSLKACRCGDRVAADASNLPARLRSFDVVTALGSVYNHLKRVGEAFRDVSRVLKRGGFFITDVDNAVCVDMLYEYFIFQGAGKFIEALKRGVVRGYWESADGEIPFNYYTYFYVKSALRRAGLELVEARPIYLMPLLPTRLLQRRMRARFLEKLDVLKLLAPFATTVIYVAKKPP